MTKSVSHHFRSTVGVSRALPAVVVVLALIGAPLAFSSAAVADNGMAGAGFVDGFEDLPLMDALSPVTDTGVLFDKPAGRIVQATVEGGLDRSRVRSFYAETLPQLGWRPAGEDRFEREGEILSIHFAEDAGRLFVGFALTPDHQEAAR